MTTKHVSFYSTDRLQLPGLLYEPTKPTKQIVVWLHGMGDSGVFYKPKLISALAQSLTEQGLALLAFNNRGAHNSKTLHRDDPELSKTDQRFQAGTHFELIVDCVKDIDGAIQFLQNAGYETFYLAGHSTGANKICVYDNQAKQNVFEKYILAGPGDDIGLSFMSIGESKFKAAMIYAETALKKGQPLKTMPIYSGMHPFSTQSAFDILNPDGLYNSFPYYETVNGALGQKKLFKEYSLIKRPMLVIAGSLDEAMASANSAEAGLAILKAAANKATAAKSDFQLIPEAGHTFDGYEIEFAERVAAWLK